MSDASVLGLPSVFAFEGAEYPFGERTIDVELAFVGWLQAKGYLVLERHRDLLGAAYPARVDAWQRDCTAGVYDWNEAACVRALWTDEGLRRMALLRLQYGEARQAEAAVRSGRPVPPPRASGELVDRVWKDPAKRDELAARSLDLAPEGPGPNAAGG